VRHQTRTATLFALASLAATAFASELGATGFTTDELTHFATVLQAAVRRNDPEQVAKYVSFPLRINNASGQSRTLTRAKFRVQYGKVFTPDVKAAVMRQDTDSLHQSWRGTMFGNGVVWASGVCEDKACTSRKLLVTAINLPAH
jgi:hypothetical protein